MKAITICQPYAELIMLPRTHRHFKRTENRTWHTGYRGPLLIHAGKSRSWLFEDGATGFDNYGIEIAKMAFGAIVGIVDMIDCLRPDDVRRKYAALRDHQHIEGPWCHVYANVRRFAVPIPYKGAQGFFTVAESVVSLAKGQAPA